MKVLSSFAELALVLEANTVGALVAAEVAMHKSAKVVQKDAQDRIGEYQKETGPFQDWSPLADSTEDEKIRLGYPVDAPLLRDGTLRDSIEVEYAPHEAIIGSKMDIAAYQEFGTEKIPPRPFLGPAAFVNQEKIADLIGAVVASGIAGGVRIHPSLGYDFEQKALTK